MNEKSSDLWIQPNGIELTKEQLEQILIKKELQIENDEQQEKNKNHVPHQQFRKSYRIIFI